MFTTSRYASAAYGVVVYLFVRHKSEFYRNGQFSDAEDLGEIAMVSPAFDGGAR